MKIRLKPVELETLSHTTRDYLVNAPDGFATLITKEWAELVEEPIPEGAWCFFWDDDPHNGKAIGHYNRFQHNAKRPHVSEHEISWQHARRLIPEDLRLPGEPEDWWRRDGAK